MEPISRIDVTEGRLYFRGIDATELAAKRKFEDVFHLLVTGRLPSPREARAMVREMIDA